MMDAFTPGAELMSQRKRRLSDAESIRELKQLLREHGPHRLPWYFRVGELVTRARQSRGGGYGRFAELLEELVGHFASNAASRETKLETLRSVLDKSRQLADVYSRRQIEAFDAGSGSFRLGWGHLRLIIGLPARMRAQLEQAAIEKRWSQVELQLEIRRIRGRQKTGGRTARRIPDAEHALRLLLEECDAWIRRVDQRWLDEDVEIGTKEIRRLRRNEPELIDSVDDALAALRRKAGRVRKLLPQESRQRTNVAKTKSNRAKARR